MKLRYFLSWELNDPIKVLMTVFTIPVLSYLLAVGYLRVIPEFGMFQGSAPPSFSSRTLLSSMTANWLLTYSSLDAGFWILLALFGAVISVFTIRYERDKGYAFSIYSLPYARSIIYTAKVGSILIFSTLVAFVPLISVVALLNVDVIGVVMSVLTSEYFLNIMVFTFYFILFVVAVSVFFGVLFKDMFLSFLGAFFFIVVPYFSSLDLPPFSFLRGITNILNGASPLSSNYLLDGLLVPALLLCASWIVFKWRDVL